MKTAPRITLQESKETEITDDYPRVSSNRIGYEKANPKVLRHSLQVNVVSRAQSTRETLSNHSELQIPKERHLAKSLDLLSLSLCNEWYKSYEWFKREALGEIFLEEFPYDPIVGLLYSEWFDNRTEERERDRAAVRVVQKCRPDRALDLNALASLPEQYVGKWVALSFGKIIGSSERLSTLRENVEKQQLPQSPLFHKVL